VRNIDDGMLPADNNWVENQIRPLALGRSNWLFAASLRAGKRAAAVMSLLRSARLNGHDPYAYVRDVLAGATAYASGKKGQRVAAAPLAPVSRRSLSTPAASGPAGT
jgi:hypothetical protein